MIAVDLDRLDAAVQDCIQVNLSVLADTYHGAGTHVRLGSRLDFAPAAGPGGLPTVEATVSERIERDGELLGLTSSSVELPDVLPAEPLYVVADAFDLPWVPYHGRQHLEHSFLVAAGPAPGEACLVDAYHNETRWGPARPNRWSMPTAELRPLLDGVRAWRLRPVTLPELPVHEVVRGNAERLGEAVASGVVERYVAAYRDHADRLAAVERLTLETWLLARSRQLHAVWLATVGIDRTMPGWASLAEQAYIALRRVQRGRPEPPGLADRLHELLLADFGTVRTLEQEHEWNPAQSSRP